MRYFIRQEQINNIKQVRLDQMRRYWILFFSFICILTFSVQSQNICTSCIDNAGQFTCFSQGCQGFQLDTNQTNFNSSSLMCRGGGNSCYFQLTQNSTVVTYLFCNYSLPNCNSCNNNITCSTCYQGFYQYQYNLANQLSNCQPCTIILGCLQCSSQTACTQCFYQYVTSGGSCLFLNGSQVGPFPYYNTGASTPAEITRSVLILGVMIFIAVAMILFFCKGKKRYPELLTQQNTSLHIEERI